MGGNTIKVLQMAPKDTITQKVENYRSLNVTGWIVMRNT